MFFRWHVPVTFVHDRKSAMNVPSLGPRSGFDPNCDELIGRGATLLLFDFGGRPYQENRGDSAKVKSASGTYRKSLDSFPSNIGFWVLESVVWVVSLLLAAHAGAGTGRNPLTKPSVSDDMGIKGGSGTRTGHAADLPSVQLGRKTMLSFEGEAARRKMQAAYSRLPLSFEPNLGQAEPGVQFLSRSSGGSLAFRGYETLVELPDSLQATGPKQTGSDAARTQGRPLTLRTKLMRTRSHIEVSGEGELPTKSNYFRGADPQKWQTRVPHYSRIHYRNVYPHIDVIYYGNQEQLEYDFIISPGGNFRDIILNFRAAETQQERCRTKIDSAGDLELHTPVGRLIQKKPAAYQEIDGIRREISSKYVSKGRSRVGFEVGSYDPNRPLVIDPVLSYAATGVGGSAIAVDSQGNAYVVGPASPSFVTTPGALQSAPGGGSCVNGPRLVPCPDVLVAKLNSDGTALIYATFVGGSGSEYGYGIAADTAGSVYITGTTTSTDFPTTVNALQRAYNGGNCSTEPCNNAFVTKLDATGSALVYSTYLHGESGGRGGNGIAVDGARCAYITGDQDNDEAFVTKLNYTGSAVIYTVSGLGGSAIAIDAERNAYVTGRHGKDSFVSKLTTDARMVYSFRLGGSVPAYSASPQEVEALTAIAVDSSGNAYVTGYTAYTDFPTTSGAAFRTAPGAGICGNSICLDAFVSKVNASGTDLVYSTYLGGNSIDYANAIAVDADGTAYVTGVTQSADFPIVNSQISSAGGHIFISKLNNKGTSFVYSMTLGNGNSLESGNGIALDASSNVYLTGNAGGDFSATPESFQPDSGNNSVFVARLLKDLTLFVPVILSSTGQGGTFFDSELTLTNRAPKETTIDLTYTAAFGSGSGKAKDTLAPSRQRLIPDAVSYLKSLGIPIPDSGNRGGTLSIRFSGAGLASQGAATIRTTTAVKQGRVGLAYRGVPGGFTETIYLCGLRHNGTDRSNVAIQHAGLPTEGEITLRLTVFSGNPLDPGPKAIYDEKLSPGGFRQISSILQSQPPTLNQGFVRVERIHGNAPYYAYAVINDQLSADSSFVPPVPISSLLGRKGLTLPVIVESSTFSSEAVLTNWSQSEETVQLVFVADGIQTPDSMTDIRLILRAQEQLILPNVVDWLRQHGAQGLGSRKIEYRGALFLKVEEGDVSHIFLGARTSTAASGGGRYGVFYSAVPYGSASSSSTWIYGLQQNSENRTNLGLVNTAEMNQSLDTFRIEIYDGDTGLKVNAITGITIGAGRSLQFGSLLAKYAPRTQQGYIHIVRVKGSNPFIGYSIINDGSQAGERTGDGAYISGSP